jgi:DNA-binding NtrC family response regulator
MTGSGSIPAAVQATKAGAYDFLTKPFENPDVVTLMIQKAIERRDLLNRARYLESQVQLESQFEDIIGKGPKMNRVFRLIQSVAPSDATVLVLGESGTGKELVARAIHQRSARSSRRFVAANCAAFPENLLESELFGHVRGAFTGATISRKGLFEEADGGTLFLDEIGETTPAMQVKLLRALQDGEIKPVGSNDVRHVDVRIIAATNIDLPTLIKQEKFREDLYYRINVVPITLPPLRERIEDIPLLVHHFLRKYCKKAKKEIHGMEADFISLLNAYRWPGNVRELENTIERAVILCNVSTLAKEALPEALLTLSEPNKGAARRAFDMPYRDARRVALSSFDREYIEDLLARAGGIVAEAARKAGMDRSNFRRLLHRYKIEPGHWKLS